MTVVDSESFGKLFRGIESQMRVAFHASGARVFWPQQFAHADSDIEDILRAFKKLRDDGRVKIVVDLLCADGHRLRTVRPEELEQELDFWEHCPRCEESSDTEVHTQLRAELTQQWEDEILKELATLEKKRRRGGLN